MTIPTPDSESPRGVLRKTPFVAIPLILAALIGLHFLRGLLRK